MMDSRHRRIAASASLAAAAFLFQIAHTLATAPAALPGTTTNTTMTAASSASLGCNQTCRDHSAKISVPYPFGFSPGCPIQLNCNPDGTVLIGEFPVQDIMADSILVSVSARCDRTFGIIDQLYGPNFAPTSKNEIILSNCTQPSKCRSQFTAVNDQYHRPCNTSSEMMGYYYDKDNGSEFLSYGKLSEMKCGIFVSSTVESQYATNLWDVQTETMQLDWWVNGDACKCSSRAECTQVPSMPGRGNGYRCPCKKAYGNGFLDGPSCKNYMWPMDPVILAIVSVVVGSAVVGILLFVCVRNCIQGKCWPRRRNRQGDVDTLMQSQGSSLPRRYKYRDLKKLTRSFSEKLGEGGYGVVYKGKLRKNDRLVAVKVLKDSKGDGEEFINEVASISRTAHLNIVELLGFCYQGKKRALLYDYMPNGSLDKFLPKSMDQGSLTCPLEWKALHRIAIGVARGLEYLHQGCNTRILHFDIKPQNILLDHDFTPKISDFGLAKLCQGRDSIVSMLGTRGTIGYIAPEVFSRNFGAVSHKSDVYSYGMLLFEVIGGKDRTGVEASRSSEMYFPDWVYKHIESGKPLWMSEINSPEDEEIAKKMTIVSLWCIQTHPSDRPSISKVIEMLEGGFDLLGVPPKPLLSPRRGLASNRGTTTALSSEQSSSAFVDL